MLVGADDGKLASEDFSPPTFKRVLMENKQGGGEELDNGPSSPIPSLCLRLLRNAVPSCLTAKEVQAGGQQGTCLVSGKTHCGLLASHAAPNLFQEFRVDREPLFHKVALSLAVER